MATLALALSLGLKFSEVCRAPSYLCLCATRVVHVDAYLTRLARPCYCICGVAAGGIQWMRGPRCFDRGPLIGDDGERSRRGLMETHLGMGKAHELSTELPDTELGFCKGLHARGFNKD